MQSSLSSARVNVGDDVRTREKLKRFFRGRKIFVSYRRSDSAGYAAQLSAALRRGYRQVFLDYQEIPAGARWQDVLEERLADLEERKT